MLIMDNILIMDQRQVLSANQVQSLEILTFANQELENFLTNEYLENPMLECTLNKQDEMVKDLEMVYERSRTYKDHYVEWGDEENNRRNDVRAKDPDEIQEFLLGQLRQSEYSMAERRLMEYLIKCLDEKGFFVYEPAEITDTTGYPEAMVEKCLNVMKNLEPAGIFAANIAECLKKQIEVAGYHDEKLLLMIERYMPDLLEGHIGMVSRSLQLTTAKVREYIHLIGTLNPRPIMSIQAEDPEYIVPDILVTLEKGRWNVKINDNWMGEYKLNDYYIHMMQSAKDEDLKQYFREKLSRARFIVNCVGQRRKTIVMVMEAILEVQNDYFRYDQPLKPMCLEDIARKIDMHVSTVSRTIKDKYVQYKHVVLLKDLFTAAAISQEDISVDLVKRKVEELIRKENPQNPLSDMKITELMKGEGVEISRRTIAKYRGQLGIPDSRQRLYIG